MRFSFGRIAVLALGGFAGVMLLRRSVKRRACSFAGRVVVITGGARGLGLELARLWGAAGARIAICSRTGSEVQVALNELHAHGYTVHGEECDVTDQAQIDSFLQRVTYTWGPLDVLVNNAGIIQSGPVECMTLEDFRATMDTHFWGPLYAIRAVLPSMMQRGEGRIVNISSIGGKISVPHLIPYCASKFALVGLSEGLHAELSRHGIKVLTVCPGLMRTGSARNAFFKGQHEAEYAWFSIASSLPVLTINSTCAARRIFEACRRGDAEIAVSGVAAIAETGHGLLTSLGTRVLAWFNRLLPAATNSEETRRGWQSQSSWSPSWLTALNDRAAVRNNEMNSRVPRAGIAEPR